MEFDIKLTAASEKILSTLATAGKIDLRPTLKVIGIGYRKEVEAIFNKQQSRGEGLKWPQLSDNPPGEGYASWKQKHYPGKPLLVRTGTLKDSMTQQGSPGNISIITKTSAVFGSSIFYGIYHDSGESRNSNLPRRNFSEPSEGRRKIWEQQLTKDIIHNFEVNNISVKGDIIQ